MVHGVLILFGCLVSMEVFSLGITIVCFTLGSIAIAGDFSNAAGDVSIAIDSGGC